MLMIQNEGEAWMNGRGIEGQRWGGRNTSTIKKKWVPFFLQTKIYKKQKEKKYITSSDLNVQKYYCLLLEHSQCYFFLMKYKIKRLSEGEKSQRGFLVEG